jgi:predicted regulator of Ras-like GTPase activity (Roadblock/LC7/MglB family)
MSTKERIGNNIGTSSAPAVNTPEQGFSQTVESVNVEAGSEQVAKAGSAFATRENKTRTDGLSKGKLLLLGGGLAVAVLFFVFTAIQDKSQSKQIAVKQPTPQSKQPDAKPAKGSVTPVMDTVHPSAPDNTGGQLAPGDIRRTRTAIDVMGAKPDTDVTQKPTAAKPVAGRTLASVPRFEDTQQKWEDPAPYGEAPNSPAAQTQQQGTMKEPSIVFVRSLVQGSAGTLSKASVDSDATPRLNLTPGTRVEAKLETQISSAVLTPVVAVVEYTYAIGDRIVIPAGARVYGALQQADRSGLVSVKFDEIELLDGVREKIEAVGTGLDLGPIKGNVYGKNTGKNFLVRAASGIGSMLAEVAGNNSSAAFSEGDMLRERLAANIGTAGDTEIMSLNTNSRVVVSVPADTKIYIVFTKRDESNIGLRKVTSAAQ